MLQLLLAKDDSAFTQLEIKLRNVLRRYVAPFTRDANLKRVEDSDSLYNIALLKMHEALLNFYYEPSFTKEHNERRFLSMVAKYVKNAMIDVQYAAKALKRKPDGCLMQFASTEREGDTDHSSYGFFTCEFEPEDKTQETAHQLLVEKEARCSIIERLEGKEIEIFELLKDGHTAEGIAGKTGMLISRVRHVIYDRIQANAVCFASA